MQIVFSRHAEDKFGILARHNISISRELVEQAVKSPTLLDRSRWPLLIAQIAFDNTRVLRVVYKQDDEVIFVITFYPGRKSQYEKVSND